MVMVSFFFFLMIRRPPRSTHCISSAASDVYKRQSQFLIICYFYYFCIMLLHEYISYNKEDKDYFKQYVFVVALQHQHVQGLLSLAVPILKFQICVILTPQHCFISINPYSIPCTLR
eukprot:TRINITY_DN9702_c0_g1_i1.p3 TRINITY_DN9702_c0_g1~~TRINITY_DN9702_c0_g1_i1.p3  ORF type:complete len:117 (+),score=20.21 TRINITY_DN9702_c0_g1_i1:103-453(+)